MFSVVPALAGRREIAMNASTPSRPLDLSRLYRRCVFRSDTQAESHHQVASALSDHDLRWSRGPADTALFKAGVNDLQIMALRYGAEVEVMPAVFQDFSLVHMSLRGVMEVEADGRKVCVGPGRSALIAPRKNIRMRWQKGAEQLIIKVPKALLEEVRHGQGGAAGLDPVLLLPEAAVAQWDLLVQSLLTSADRAPGNEVAQAWLQHFERNVALFLLSCPQGGAPSQMRHPEPEALSSPESVRRMEALDAYIHTKLCAPVSTFDLARVIGVSVRTLNLLCRRYRGCTPMELLRNRRLDAVRAHLLSKPGVNVTSAALEHGFGHLGRFAAYYRERFGELPNQTAASVSAAVQRLSAGTIAGIG